MTITLNHTIVPARDKETAARFFAHLFGLTFESPSGHFAPVRVNETLTLDFDDAVAAFESHHDAFHVSDAEFDGILQRVQEAGLPFGSTPWSLDDGKLNDWNGGRGVYFKDRDGHILELMTQGRRMTEPKSLDGKPFTLEQAYRACGKDLPEHSGNECRGS